MSLRRKLAKADWLREMQVALALGAGTVAVAIGVVGWDVVTGAPVDAGVPARAITGLSGSAGGLTGGGMIGADSMVEVTIAEPSRHQAIAHAFTALPGLLVALTMLVILTWVVGTARLADPFTGATVRRLRVLAVSILIGGVVANMVETLAALDLALSVSPDLVAATWVFPGQWLLLGFGFLAIAEVIKRGAAMRAELETVI